LLLRLEKADKGSKTALTDDLPLFAATQTRRLAPKGPGPLELAVNEINPDSLTPLQALEVLYKLKGLSLDEE
jgi:DNA mismatch repair protein MutS